MSKKQLGNFYTTNYKNILTKMEIPNCVQTVLEPRFSRRILSICFLSLVSAAVAAQCGLYDCMGVALAVFVNSINYWRHPTHGIRRNLDMLTAFTGCVYQIHKSFSSRTQMLYFVCLYCGVSCYGFARFCKSKYYSSLWHCGIHIFGNIGNVVLYYGL
jgi:hypothetical protein